MVFKQEVNIPLALTIGLISGILLLVMTFGMQAWYESAEQTMVAERTMDAPKSDYVQMKQDQASTIRQYGWADKTRTTVRIPIDKAMEIMVATAGKLPGTQPASQPSTTQPAAVRPSASIDTTK